MKKRARHSAAPAVVPEAPAAPTFWDRFQAALDRYAVWIAIGLTLIASVRIASTYKIFSHTFDEPAHIACGMEWLEKHTYTYEAQHPPLTRVMTALLPKMAGRHDLGIKNMWDEGIAIVFVNGSEDATLALARAGTLPFFWIACAVVFLCARWIGGGAAGAIAVFLLTMTPTVLAHAGLATTDMGLTAMLLLAVYMGWRWIEEPVWWRACAFGGSLGLAVLAKFSALPFLPMIALIGLAMGWFFERRMIAVRWVQFVAAVAIAALVIWAGYRFSFKGYPAPELFAGIGEVRKHNANGHLTYLLGLANTVGWWYFYLVALAVKTPLAILALGVSGLVLMFSRKRFGSRGWIAPSIVLGILIFASLFSQIKIGTRHVMPVFAAFAIAGGCAAVAIPQIVRQKTVAAWGVVLLLVSAAVSSGLAHPNYISYFNFIAGDKPEDYLIDSDLDWGQDAKRLAARLKEVGAKEVYFNQFGPGSFEKLYGFPPIHPLDVNGPSVGWNAIDITPMKLGLWGDTRYVYERGDQFWPDKLIGAERVGSSYLLYYRAK